MIRRALACLLLIATEAEVDRRVRGAIVVEQVDGEWLISVPACVD